LGVSQSYNQAELGEKLEYLGLAAGVQINREPPGVRKNGRLNGASAYENQWLGGRFGEEREDFQYFILALEEFGIHRASTFMMAS